MAVFTDMTFLCLGFLINTITLKVFWSQRKHGQESRKTVEKHAFNLLLIALGDFVTHILRTTTDVGQFDWVSHEFHLDSNIHIPQSKHQHGIYGQCLCSNHTTNRVHSTVARRLNLRFLTKTQNCHALIQRKFGRQQVRCWVWNNSIIDGFQPHGRPSYQQTKRCCIQSTNTVIHID